MSIQWQYMYKVMCFSILLGLSALFLAMISPAQAGVYYNSGYGHHGYGYGHYSGHGYGYRNHGAYGYGGHSYYRHGYPLFFGQYYSYNDGSYYNNRSDYYASSRSSYSNDVLAGSTIDAQQYDDKAWRLLALGKTDKAFTYFSKAAQARPNKGSPKIGYALAAADLGQLDKGIWAMRRALNIDPSALHYVTLNHKLDAKVRRMIDDYVQKQAYSGKGANSSFMLASLHYLRRDMKLAQSYINQAMLARHVNSSTKNLNDLINREINS